MNPQGDALLAALAELAARLAAIAPREPCWLIGSAAAAVAGVQGIEPHDLDLLLGERDAEAFTARHRDLVDGYTPGDAARFRSRFARIRFDGWPVEVMGGLQVRREGRWETVEIGERLPVPGIDEPLRVPSLREQLRLFERFGRDKDLAKARLIHLHLAREDAAHAA